MAAQVEECALTPEVEAALQHPSGWRCLPVLIDEIRHGIAQLWKCTDSNHLMYVITRVDSTPPELCLTWARGTGARVFGPLFVAVAKKRGMNVRVHVEGMSRVRLFRRCGFVLDEYVLRG